MPPKLTQTLQASHPLPHVDEYLAVGQRGGASDVHLGVNGPPIWRVYGSLPTSSAGARPVSSGPTLALWGWLFLNPGKRQIKGGCQAAFALRNRVRRCRN